MVRIAGCVFISTHTCSHTHTHTHTLLWPRRDKIEKSAELVSCLELTTSVRLRLPPALLQHSADVIWGAELVASCLSLSLSPTFIMLYLLWTLGGAGERRMSIEQPWIGSLSGHFMCLCWRPPEALFVLYEHYVCLKNNVMEFRCREKAEQFISTSMHLFKSEQWVFFILVIWVCVCTRESC